MFALKVVGVLVKRMCDVVGAVDVLVFIWPGRGTGLGGMGLWVVLWWLETLSIDMWHSAITVFLQRI